MVCTGGSCAACSPNAKQCNGLQPQVCASSGAWQNMGTACPFVCDGTTGTCTGTCTPGAKQCSGLQPQVCSASGTWTSSGSPCPFVCSAATGACTGTCVPGAKQCATSQPQVCSASGAWQNSGSACGVCNPCSTSTGTCTVAAGSDCDDGNACTSGTKCQTNGTCGGGTTITSCPGADACHTVGACVPATGCPTPAVQTGAMCTAAVVDPCVITTCQTNGTCGGNTPAPKNTSCGNNRFCDGNRMCKCRQPSTGNLLTNPGFDVSASPWSLFRASYSEIDVDGCTGSGSINTSGGGASVFQCVPINPSTRYYFYYRFRTASGSGQADCSLRFYGGGSCSSGVQGTLFSHNAVAPEGGVWAQGRLETLSDSTSTHVYISCAATTTAGFYDQFYLGTASIPASMPAF